MRNRSKRKIIIKALFLAVVLMVTAACLCMLLPSCAGAKSTMKVGFVSADYCIDGVIDESKTTPELNAQVDERVYMFVDFKIKAPRDNDGRGEVHLTCDISPASEINATVQETNTSETTEKTVDGVTTITAAYSIPDKKTDIRDVRFLVRIYPKGSVVADITLKLENVSGVKAVKNTTVKKQAILGYTDKLIFNENEVTGVTDKEIKEVIIPTQFNGKAITGISNRAFEDCDKLTKIFIPEGIKSLGKSADSDYAGTFSGCGSLTDIKIPSTVKGALYGYTFKNCSSLESIQIPDGITSFSDSVFEGCTKLKQVNIPKKMKSIPSSCFKGCVGLTEIIIPDKVTKIENEAFNSCTSLEKIALPKSVTKIEWNAFANCSALKEINLPDKLTYIGESAFKGCSSLAEIIIPKNVKEIKHEVFDGCSNLAYVEYNATDCSYIGYEINYWNTSKNKSFSMFSNTGLKELKIGEKVKSIPACMFKACKSLEEITIESCGSFGYLAFDGCDGLKRVRIGKGVTSKAVWVANYYLDRDSFRNKIVTTKKAIDFYEVFGNGSIESIEVEDGNKDYKSVDNCLLIKDGKTLIWGCKNSAIPDGVTAIGEKAFSSCGGLVRLTVPASVTSIGESAFYGCEKLGLIDFKGRTAQWNTITKGSSWNANTGEYAVLCVNGRLDKKGNAIG